MTERAQAHTLEAVVAGMLILTSLVFALQVTAVTPLSASTASQHIENQQDASAKGLLSTAADSGALKRTVLYWNDTQNHSRFHGADLNKYYSNAEPPTTFGEMLASTYGDRGLAYNVYVVHEDAATDLPARQRLVFRGQPSDHAISASHTVVVYDDDRLVGPKELPTGTNVSSAEAIYMDDAAPNSVVYNVVRVEVIVWRM